MATEIYYRLAGKTEINDILSKWTEYTKDIVKRPAVVAIKNGEIIGFISTHGAYPDMLVVGPPGS